MERVLRLALHCLVSASFLIPSQPAASRTAQRRMTDDARGKAYLTTTTRLLSWQPASVERSTK